MTATPAQIANDMAAHALVWEKRDRDVAEVCRDCARVIRSMLSGERVDGRTLGGIEHRLRNIEQRYGSRADLTIGTSLYRGLMTLQKMRSDQARAAT